MIFLMAFDATWTDENIGLGVKLVSKIPQMEPELIVDASGLIHVQRIIACEAPPKYLPFQSPRTMAAEEVFGHPLFASHSRLSTSYRESAEF